MEDDTPMPIYFKIIFAMVAGVVELGIIYMVFPLWKRIIMKTGAMTLTHRGIENTFAFFNVFAFWTAFKIDFIPWNALVFNDNGMSISVKTEFIPEECCSKLTKLLLSSEFNFSIGKITYEEMKNYRDAALEMHQV